MRLRKTAEPPARHVAYFELMDALREEGCAVCRRVAITARRCLESFRDELVNDPALREKLRASLGFCPDHAREFDALASRLAVAILYEDLLKRMDRDLDDWVKPRRRADPHQPCLACTAEADQDERSVQVLADFISDPELSEAYRKSSGLCRRHTVVLCRRLPAPERGRVLDQEKARIRSLLEELAEVRRKSDHRFAREPWGEEATAPTRAIRKITGE